MKPKPLTVGSIFSRLTVEAVSGRGGRRASLRCECGKTITEHAGALESGHTKSCGCLHRDLVRIKNTRHGGRGLPVYRIWIAIIERCENPKSTGYHLYGGRGIRVCERWRESFPAFLADMGERPSDRHSIDRVDPNGNYEPANCRWATGSEQAKTKRGARLITYQGEQYTAMGLARELSIPYSAFRSRIRKGESVDQILSALRTQP
jgi:hypothetical protein